MINLQIDEGLSIQIDPAVLEDAAQAVLKGSGPQVASELTIVLTGDARVQALNKEYMGIDAPTDVLSFPAGDTDPDTGNLYLGDIIISFPRALAQAGAGAHPIEAELQLLVVHGVLHLLGYDHGDDQEKAAMWARQAEALRALGSPITGSSE